jgi:hypothetical protein
MKENKEKIISQKERDDAVLNFVNFQAQEAILNPNLPEDFKNLIVGDAVRKIQRIGERRATYQVQHDRKAHEIYEG